MLTIPDRWGPSWLSEPRLPFLSLPGTSAQLTDPFQRSFGIAPSRLLVRGRQGSGEAANRWDGQG